VDNLQVGMRVRHPDWGIGTIKERIGEGEDLKVVVTFAGVGRKKLAAKFVHLERA
jgi:DNA helicase-2/ATP-dependent DNA helicase PcrA